MNQTEAVAPLPPRRTSVPVPSAVRPLVSVIIPVFNAEETLGSQLQALATQSFADAWEVVIVDDGSTDRSLDIAASFADRLPLRIVRAPGNGGAARARNLGARDAEGALLAFVDADDVVAPGWLCSVATTLRDHEAAASRFDTEQLNDAASRATRGPLQADGLQSYTYPAFLPHAGGSGLMVRREVHERIGGFDESLAYLEDTDYTWRLQRSGVDLHFEPSAVVQVRFREGNRATFRQAYNYGYYNVVLFARYRRAGMGAIDKRHGLRSWWNLLKPARLLGLRDPLARTRWMRGMGWRLGRLVASVRYRVWAL